MEKEAEKKLIDDVDKYSRDDEVIALYSAYSKQELEHNTILIEETEKAKISGRKEGLQEGISQTKIEIARKMVKENMDTNIISKITGLTEEEIKELKI